MAWYIAYMEWTILDKNVANRMGYKKYGTTRRVSGKTKKDAEMKARKKYSSRGTNLKIRIEEYPKSLWG